MLDTLIALKELDAEYADLQAERKAVEQRIWAIIARAYRKPDTLTHDKPKIEAKKAEILRRKAEPGHPLAIRCEIFVQCYETISTKEKAVKKHMETLAKTLPVWEWVSRQKGAGALNLARVAGNLGGRDMGEFTTPAKLWKRFGLDVRNGKAPKPTKGEQLGHSPARRAIAHNLGDSLMKASGSWKVVYDARKKFEIEQAGERGLEVRPAAKIPAKRASEFMSDGHVHKRALRYMQKKFLSALWEEWTGDRREENLPAFISKEKLASRDAVVYAP